MTLAFVLVVAGGVQLHAQPPARDTPQPRVGTGRIRGSVVAADTAQPLRQAQVRITSPEIRESRVSTTDGEGRFEFIGLPAGRYNLNASKSSYVGLAYGQRMPNDTTSALELKDGQVAERITFRLPRGGVIAGRILDAYGEPMADVMVMPLRSQYSQGQRRLLPAGRSSSSNDIGEFRLYGLTPGQYVVAAIYRNLGGGLDVSTDREGYAPTFYPGTPDMAAAQRLSLEAGQNIGELTMVLTSARTARITGTVYDSQGRLITRGGGVTVTSKNAAMAGQLFTVANGPIRPDGTFVVNHVPPGEYTLRANSPSTVGGSNAPPEYSVADVIVSGDDIANVTLFPQRPVTIKGSIVIAQGARQDLRPEQFRFTLVPTSPTTMSMPGSSAVPQPAREDLTFEVTGVHGQMLLRTAGAPAGWAISAVRYNAVDVTDMGLTIDGSTAGDLEVEVTSVLQDVSGQVTDGKGQLVSSYVVLIVTQDRDRWATAMTRSYAIGRPMRENRFAVRNLAPGDYYALAFGNLDMSDARDPEFLETLRSRASTFSLREGQTLSLDLKLVEP